MNNQALKLLLAGALTALSANIYAQSQELIETQFPEGATQNQTQDECQTFFNSQTNQEEESCPDQTGSSTRSQTTDFLGNLNDRILQQRHSFGANRNRNAALPAPRGGAASADSDIGASGRLSPFVVVDGGETDRRATNAGLAYEQDANALILGVDYRLRDDLIAGATLSYLRSDTDYDNNRGETDNDTYILGFHASRYWGDIYVDALLTYGQIDLDIERISASTEYEGSTDGDFHSAEFAAGRMFNHRQWTITPSVRLLHVRGELDSYSETTSASFVPPPLSYDDQKFDSLNARAALQVDYVVLTGWGVLVPSLYFAYNHEHLGADKVNASTGGAFPFTVEQIGDDPIKNYKLGRLNLAAQFKGGLSGFLSYERLIDHERLDRDTVALGVRYELP